MRLGFNYPWARHEFSANFGPYFWVDDAEWNKNNVLEASDQLPLIPLPPLFKHVDRNLANLKKMGFSVIRWFLLGNGQSYGPAPTRYMKSITLVSPPYDYNFNPPTTLDKRFRRDFEELLRRFKAAQLQLIPSLISFEFGSNLAAGGGPHGTGYGGRADVIRDPARRKVFLDTMLAELLTASAPFKEQIYAWEVINEPVWLCIEFGPLSRPKWWVPRTPEVSFSEMSDFLKDAITRIEKAGFQSTVGHRYFDDLARFPPGSIPQFHYYADHRYATERYKSDPANIKGTQLFGRNPKPILGEFASSEDPVYHDNPWKYDLGGVDSTLERLKLLDHEHCDLALIWPDRSSNEKAVADNDVIKLLSTTRNDIIKYTNGKLPPENE
jgi:hypothetical protein